MSQVIAGRGSVRLLRTQVDQDVTGYDDLTDLELLATALHDALTARHAGQLGGPGVDEAALQRAARRARRQAATVLLRTQVGALRQMVRAAA